MPDVELPAVLVAAIAAFVLGFAYYTVFAEQWAQATQTGSRDEQPAPWRLAVEFMRGLILVAVVAGLAAQGDVDGWSGGLLLGFVLWLGFPAVLWSGAMLWEKTPWKLAAIHAGDWLAKLLVVGVIVSSW